MLFDAPIPKDGKADAPTRVFCPQCAYELAAWELQTARTLECPLCAGELELGVTVPLDMSLV